MKANQPFFSTRCQLELRWVEPDEIPYETKDAALIPFNGDKSESRMSGKTSQPSETQSPQGMTYQNDTQDIEKVCLHLVQIHPIAVLPGDYCAHQCQMSTTQ
jgi:hypothetical protein